MRVIVTEGFSCYDLDLDLDQTLLETCVSFPSSRFTSNSSVPAELQQGILLMQEVRYMSSSGVFV